MKCMGIGRAIFVLILLTLITWASSWLAPTEYQKIIYGVGGVAMGFAVILAILCLFFEKKGQLSFS
jgi:hypothetical protein